MTGNRQATVLIGGIVVLGAALAFFLWPEAEANVVLYCGVDQDQSRQISDLFADETGLDVDYHGESEASRSVGLPKRLKEERGNPRADVYWSNEIMHMVELARSGILAKLPAGLAEEFPAEWRDPEGYFILFGARARVLLVNVDLLPDESTHPTSVADLVDPKWKAQGLHTVMAAPLTGTTYTHAVALLSEDEKAGRAFFEQCRDAATDGRLKIVKSNGRVMRAVSEKGGKVAFGLTDTDDALIALENMRSGKGATVRVVYPDQGNGGTVLIPNTAALVKGGAHPAAGERLLRWLARPATEHRLANGPSAQIPVRPGVGDLPAHVKQPGKDFAVRRIDWWKVGQNVNTWHDYLVRLFRPVD